MTARSQVAWLVILCAVVLQANGRAHPEVDTMAAPYVAWSLLRQGNLDVRAYPTLDKYPTHVHDTTQGQRISIRPIGDALFIAPFLLPHALAREQPPTDSTLQYIGKLAGTMAVIGSVLLMFLTCRFVAPAAAFPASLLLGLGTCLASTASQAIWNHGPGVFWISTALYFLTSPPTRRAICFAGLALGMATISRSTTAFFAVAAGAALLSQRRWWDAVILTVSGAIPVAVQVALNLHFFGNAVAGGYENQMQAEHAPWWLSAAGLLISPSRGLLVYTPAFLLLPIGLRSLLRRTDRAASAVKPLVIFWLAAVVGTILFYGNWWCWWGGACYGPRFLIECMPVLCLLFACAYEALSRQGRALAGVLVSLSIAIHIIGLYGHNEEGRWHDRHSFEPNGIGMFDIDDMQIEAYGRNIWRKFTGQKRYD